MEVSRLNFKASEVVFTNKLISLLAKNMESKHNVQINFFTVHNPIVVFSILAHRAFHFCSIRLIKNAPESQKVFREVLDYWFSQGAEINFRSEYLEASEIQSRSVHIINSDNEDEIKKMTALFPPQTKYIIYHRVVPGVSPPDIWTFMHPLWAVGDICEYEEMSLGGETYFLIVGIVRG